MQNEVISALPTGAKANSPALRNFLINRVIYVFAPTDNPQSFEALDTDTGAMPQALAFNARVFWLDLNDSSSAHDGVAVIRTADDYRYKVNPVDNRTLSVLNFTTTTPPVSPALGDAYLVPAGATGDWSSHQDDIAKWTRNGWDFEIPVIGRWLLDEGVIGYLSYTATGWVYGPGARSFGAASIPFSAALGWGARFEVEDQTTTTPPTATKGLRYIVGPSATGVWLGKDKRLAICEITGTWTFYTPTAGWAVYDKSSSASYTYNGSAWVSSAGVWIRRTAVPLTASPAQTNTAGTNYAYSATSAPTTSNGQCLDTSSQVTHGALRVGAPLRLSYRAGVSGTATTYTVGLFRDLETTAIDWAIVQVSNTLVQCNQPFEFAAADTNPHTYKVRFMVGASAGFVTISRSQMAIEEAT